MSNQEWRVEELTPDEAAELEQTRPAPMPSCQDSEEGGFGDDTEGSVSDDELQSE